MILISAMTKNRVIGNKGQLPWHIPEEMKQFRKLTINSIIIMGKRTYEEIGRPLPKRVNIVVSSSMPKTDGLVVVRSFKKAVETAKRISKEENQEIFVIGGRTIYEQALPVVDRLYLSFIYKDYEGDVYFPEIGREWKVVREVEHDEFVFKEFQRV